MRLTWRNRPSAANTFVFVFGDDSLPRGAGQKKIVGHDAAWGRNSQVAEFAQSATVDTYDRRNSRIETSWEVGYGFSSFEERVRFVNSLAAIMGGNGELLVDYDDGGAQILRRAVVSDAAMIEQLGTSVTIRFHFTGAAWEAPA